MRGRYALPRRIDQSHARVVTQIANVLPVMLALSTYLGHAEIFCTHWYLTAVPELMALAAGKFEQFADLVGDGDD